tara:strand:- start:169 stop:1668 length:1500 start_codon:yes stop_codon:yes gene_type:complete
MSLTNVTSWDPGERIFDSYRPSQEVTDMYDLVNQLYSNYSDLYSNFESAQKAQSESYKAALKEWNRQDKAGDAADWTAYRRLNKAYESADNRLKDIHTRLEFSSKEYDKAGKNYEKLKANPESNVYTNPEGTFKNVGDDRWQNIDTGNVRRADTFRNLNNTPVTSRMNLAREEKRAKRQIELATNNPKVGRGDFETDKPRSAQPTLTERLQSNLPAAFQNQPNYTAGQKIKDFATGAWDQTKGLATEFHNRKYGLGMLPDLIGGTAQARDEYFKSLAQTAGLTNYTKENPMKITLDRGTRVRTANTVNEWLNKQSPERQEHFLSGGQPTVEELGQYEHKMAPDNSLNYALVSNEFKRKGGGDAGRWSAYYNTIHNLAGGDRDTFTGVHRGPDGKLRIGGLSDNYQFSDDEDITALNPILKPLQRAAMSIGQAKGAYKDQSNENIADYGFNQSLFSKKNQGGTGQTMRTPAHLDLSDVYRKPSIADLAKQWGRKVFKIPN